MYIKRNYHTWNKCKFQMTPFMKSHRHSKLRNEKQCQSHITSSRIYNGWKHWPTDFLEVKIKPWQGQKKETAEGQFPEQRYKKSKQITSKLNPIIYKKNKTMSNFNSKLQDRLNIVTFISLCKPGIERELIQTDTHTHMEIKENFLNTWVV